MNDNLLRKAVDARLSGLTFTPQMQADTLRRAHPAGSTRMGRKLSYSLAFALLALLLAGLVAAIFGIIIGVPALRIISVSFLLAGFCIIAGSVFQAIGNPVYSLIVSVCRQMVVLLPVAWLLSRTGRLELVWWSFPIAEVMSFTLSTIFLRRTVKSANEVMNSSAD